jgi:hypothetical protein
VCSRNVTDTCRTDAFEREVTQFEPEPHRSVSLLSERLDHLSRELIDPAAITTDRKQSVVATEPDQRWAMSRVHVGHDATVRQHTDGAVHRRLVNGRLFHLREPCQLGRIKRTTVAKQRSHDGNAWGGCPATVGSQDRFGIVDGWAVDDRCLFSIQPHEERVIT